MKLNQTNNPGPGAYQEYKYNQIGYSSPMRSIGLIRGEMAITYHNPNVGPGKYDSNKLLNHVSTIMSIHLV